MARKDNLARKELSKINTPSTEMPRSVVLANQGIETSDRFARVMAAIMADVGSGKITPQVANAMTNAGGKLLKVNEMAMKWGTSTDGGRRRLDLTA